MDRSLVMTIDFDDHSSVIAATMTDPDLGHVEPLPMSTLTDTAGWAFLDVVREGLTRTAVASARAVGVVTAPAMIVLNHPANWAPDRIAALHHAAEAAGYNGDAVIVRAARRRPTPADVPQLVLRHRSWWARLRRPRR